MTDADKTKAQRIDEFKKKQIEQLNQKLKKQSKGL